MGCSASRLEDEEAVQLCKDRRDFIKQAVEERKRFASCHIAYIQSLKRVSIALRNYIDADENFDLASDSFKHPSFEPVKRLSPEIIGIPLISSTTTPKQHVSTTYHISRYLRSNGTSLVYVQEWPHAAETVRVDSYYSSEHHGLDAIFAPHSSVPEPSHFHSPYNRPNYPPASPQNSHWDSFWNPFSSLDTFGFHYRNTYDRLYINDDDMARLRQVREEEGIPELEEEVTEQEVDDDDDDEEEKDEEFVEVERVREGTRIKREDVSDAKPKSKTTCEAKEFQSKGMETIEVSEARNVVEVEVTKEKDVVVVNKENEDETPGFTVYLDRRPKSMSEVMKVIEDEFTRICDCAQEVSMMLEASRTQYTTNSTELTVKLLNPVTLFRSASSRSMSSRFFNDSSSFRCDGYESSSDCSDDSCMISGSHQSTLDRLYTWEKKLYKEVKAGERIRIAFEKRCAQLRTQDMHGEETSVVSKTRSALQDLDTRLRISLHTVESVSKRIETLCDNELQPQLIELIQGLERMWRTMAECHRAQKHATDAAKLLLISTSNTTGKPSETAASPYQLRSASILETELRNWRSCLESWVTAQRSYARALAGWIIQCCSSPNGEGARSPLSPRRSSTGAGAPAMLGLCVQWSRLLESIGEAQVMDGLDFFAAGMGTVSAASVQSPEEEGEAATVTAEMAGKVLCAGMSVAVSSAAEFAGRSAEGYEALLVKAGTTGTRGGS